MKFTAQFQKHLEDTCQAGLDDEYPVPVEAVGDREPVVFEGFCEPGDEGLTVGAPGRQGTDPHGHTRFAAVLASGRPLPAAVTRLGRDANESTVAGEGVGHA